MKQIQKDENCMEFIEKLMLLKPSQRLQLNYVMQGMELDNQAEQSDFRLETNSTADKSSI